MPGGIIGEADILIGADASNLAKNVQRQAQANLRAAGQQLGRELSESVAKSAQAASSKIAQPLEQAARRASSAMKRPAQDFISGFRAAEAAASSLTGRMGSLGGAARKAIAPAVSQLGNLSSGYKSAQAAQSSFTGALGTLGGAAAKAVSAVTNVGPAARSAFGSAVAAAQSLPGPLGAFANVAVSASAKARDGILNFASGFTSTQAGLSALTGKMGTIGTVTRAAAASASAALRSTLPTAAKAAFGLVSKAATGAWNLVKAGASKTWEALKSGAERAAAATGAALKRGIGSAATGAAAAIAGGVATILGKGFARLNALNQAEARLTGLGIVGEQLTSVMKSADDAVTGTAFSMADAAQAAGMMASAGVQAGSSMDDAMKALVATTAASGAEMTEITPIFTKIAAAGKVTGETMAQLLDRGVNASGALQKALGKNAEEITKMVSAGEIDFSTFVEAINGDLNMLAAAMGGTLGGMVSNVLSALGRIGAEVQKPIFDGLLVAMPSMLDFIKRLATAVKEFMAPLQGQLTPIAERFAAILDGINFDGAGISKFVESLGPLLPLLGAIVGVSGALLADLPVIGALFGGLSGPIGLAAGALAALALVDPATMVAGFENIATFVSNQLPGILQGAANAIQTGLSNIVQNLPVMLGGITDILTSILLSLASTLPQIAVSLASALTAMIPSVIGALVSAIPQLLNAASTLFLSLVRGLLGAIPTLISTLLGAIPLILEAIVGAVPLVLDGALQLFTGLLTAVTIVIPQLLNAVTAAIPTILASIIGLLPNLIQAGITFFLGLVQALTSAIPQILSAVIAAVPQIIEGLLGALPAIIQAGISLFTGLVTALTETLPTLIEMVVGLVPDIIGLLVDALPLLIDGGLQLFLGLVTGLTEALPTIIAGVVGMIPRLIEAIVGAIPQIIEGAISLFLGLVTGLTQAVPQVIEAIIGAIPVLIGAIINAIPQIIEAGISLFLGLIEGLFTAVPAIIGAIIEAVPMLIEAIIGAIPQIIDAGIALFTGLAEAIPEALPKIGEAITQDLLPGIWNAITGQGKTDAEETGKSLGESAATGLTSSASSFSTAGSTLAASASTTMSGYSTTMTTTGANLGASATSGLASSQSGLNLAASNLGSGASSALGSYQGQMTSAASNLGQGAVTGLGSQTAATKSAAGQLASAATIDVTKKVEETKAAGNQIALAFASGISGGKAAAATSATQVAQAAQQSLSSVTGFVTIGQSLASGISTGITNGTPQVISSLTNLGARARATLIDGTVNPLGLAFAQLWSARLSPTLILMVAGFGSAAQRIKDTWAQMIVSLQTGYNSRIAPLLAALSTAVLTGPPTAFARAASAIVTAWSSIQEASKRPVRFVVETVMNGLISAMNQIPGVNVPKLALPAGFARGGILPGMSSMSNGDDQLIMARRGEGMMVSEALRTPADRSAFLAANAAGRRGVGFASLLNGYARGGLVTPLPKGSFSVSQPFHAGHNGIDLAAAMGTKVYAAAKGIVQLAQSVPMGGNEIYVQHDGIATRYSHLSAFAVKAGDQVRKNQVIGRVGSTGMSTGPHLHYMVHLPNDGGNGRSYGNIQNPSSYLGVYGTEVDGYMDTVNAVAANALGAFAARFPPTNMWNQATASIVGQGVKSALAHARSSLGTDDSDGASGRTGRAGFRLPTPKLFDSGGVLAHGATGVNLSGKPEAVLTNSQWKMLAQLAQGITAGNLGSSPIGQQIVAGLAAGIRSGSTSVGVATAQLSNVVLDTMRSEFEIHSPSKATERIAKYIGAGLVKGITGSVAQTKAATEKLMTTIKEQFSSLAEERKKLQEQGSKLWEKARAIDWTGNTKKAQDAAAKLDKQILAIRNKIKAIDKVTGYKGSKQAGLTKYLNDQNARLVKIATQREALAKRIDAAADVLKERRDQRTSFVDSVRSGIVGQGDISGFTTVNSMTKNLQRRISATKSFNTAITRLRALGLDETSIQQLTEDFAQSGSAKAAEKLAAGGKAAVSEVAKLQKDLASEASKLANKTGDMLYKAGIDAAVGILKGLQSQDAALVAAAKKIADTITKTVKKTLGIKSPSRVMAKLANFTVDGWVQPIQKRASEGGDAFEGMMSLPGVDGFGTLARKVGGAPLPARASATASNSTTGGGRTVIIEAGAVVVQAAEDPARTALEVVDEIVEAVNQGAL